MNPNDQITTLLLVLLTIVTLGIIPSCQQEDKVEELRTEVMAIHDEIMPEMGNLMKLKGELISKILQLDSINDRARIEELDAIVGELEDADKSMMDWMRNYKDPSTSMNQQAALKYLKDEKKRIQEVKRKFDNSKEKARKELSIKAKSDE